MFGKRRMTQEEYDRAVGHAYRLGYQMGKIEERNRTWRAQEEGLNLVEKQIVIILEKEGF